MLGFGLWFVLVDYCFYGWLGVRVCYWLISCINSVVGRNVI